MDSTFFLRSKFAGGGQKVPSKGITIYGPTTEGRKYGPTTEGRKFTPIVPSTVTRKKFTPIVPSAVIAKKFYPKVLSTIIGGKTYPLGPNNSNKKKTCA